MSGIFFPIPPMTNWEQATLGEQSGSGRLRERVEDKTTSGQIINHSDLFMVDSAHYSSAKVDSSIHLSPL